MTDRERWIVYPLLFLALGISLRTSGKFGPTKMLSCEHLQIQGADGKPGIELVGVPAANGGGGQLRLFTDNGALAIELRATPQGGVIEAVGVNGVVAAMGANGRPQVILESTPDGGMVRTFLPNQIRQVIIEPTPYGGAVATFDRLGRADGALGVRISNTPAPVQPEADKPAAEQNSTESEQPKTDTPEEKEAESTEPKSDEPESKEPASTGPEAPRGEGDKKADEPSAESQISPERR